MIVVFNTTPIITLSSIGKIDILKHFFDSSKRERFDNRSETSA